MSRFTPCSSFKNFVWYILMMLFHGIRTSTDSHNKSMANKTSILIRTKKKRAQALFESGQLAEAEALLKQIIDTAKLDFEAWKMLGSISLTFGRFEEAERHSRRAIDICPSDHKCIFQLGFSLLNQHRQEEAIECFQRAFQIRPDYVDALVIWGLPAPRWEESKMQK